MSRRPLVEAMTDAIERGAKADPRLFNSVHVRALGRELVEGGDLSLRSAARALASSLDHDIEAAKIGQGRVTNRRLDQRLRPAPTTEEPER